MRLSPWRYPVAAIISCLVVAGVVAGICLQWPSWRRQRATSRFLPVVARLEQARGHSTVLTGRHNSGDVLWTLGIRYSYRVQGKTYQSGRFAYLKWQKPAGNAPVQAWLRAHPVGGKITAYYDPREPQDAVLSRGLNMPALELVLILYLPAALGGLLLVGPLVVVGVQFLRGSLRGEPVRGGTLADCSLLGANMLGVGFLTASFFHQPQAHRVGCYVVSFVLYPVLCVILAVVISSKRLWPSQQGWTRA